MRCPPRSPVPHGLDGWIRADRIGRPAQQTIPYCVVQHEAVSQRLGVTTDTIAALDGDNYKSSDLFTDGEKALLDLTVQIGIDANRVSHDIWERVKAHYTEPQIVEAVYVITQFIAISKFGDALGVALEPAFQGGEPILHVDHAG